MWLETDLLCEVEICWCWAGNCSKILCWRTQVCSILCGPPTTVTFFKRPRSQSGCTGVSFHIFLDCPCHELIEGYHPLCHEATQIKPHWLINAGGYIVQHLVEHPVHSTSNQRCIVCTLKLKKTQVATFECKGHRSGAVHVKSSSMIQISGLMCTIHSTAVEVWCWMKSWK